MYPLTGSLKKKRSNGVGTERLDEFRPALQQPLLESLEFPERVEDRHVTPELALER